MRFKKGWPLGNPKRKAKGKVRKGIHWDYNRDGEFLNDKWNKFDQRYWKRWRRRQEKKGTKEQIDNTAK